MNSIINLTASDVTKSILEVKKDGATFDVPVQNLFNTALPLTLNSSNVSNALGLKFTLFNIDNQNNYVVVSDILYNSALPDSLVSENLHAVDPINYAEGEWGIFSSTSLPSNSIVLINNAIKTSNYTIYINKEPDTYNNFSGKTFLKYVVYNSTGSIVTEPGIITSSVLFINVV